MDIITDNEFVSEVTYVQALEKLPKYENIEYVNLGNEFLEDARYVHILLGVSWSNSGAKSVEEAKEFLDNLNKAIEVASKFVYNGLSISRLWAMNEKGQVVGVTPSEIFTPENGYGATFLSFDRPYNDLSNVKIVFECGRCGREYRESVLNVALANAENRNPCPYCSNK